MNPPKRKYTVEELKSLLQNRARSEIRIPLDQITMSQETFDVMVEWLSDPEDFDPTLTYPDVSETK